ncbi:uncharacterized protein [Rutidosis leptorrhynchoides]|uniref:uncharacterized protein n=1 Tax=Rutidosis leptorrhynchoides TaxID=125765 RepID=UPI003A9A1697
MTDERQDVRAPPTPGIFRAPPEGEDSDTDQQKGNFITTTIVPSSVAISTKPPTTETKKKCTFKQFLDCKPPEYVGSSNLTETFDWLREVGRALEACQCEPELRVTYASRLLKRKAMGWWDSITSQMSKEMLNQMTIDEVIEKFTDKLCFVQQWLPDEQSKIDQFVEMILLEYRSLKDEFWGRGRARTASDGGSSASSTGQKRKTPPRPIARAFQMSVDATTTSDDAITGMFLVNSTPARILFDCGANRSFMATRFCDKLNLPVSMLPEPLEVEVGSGKTVPVTTSVSGISIEIDGSIFLVTCLVMPIPSFDVVLGMNWLSCHKASIQCHKKLISFPLSDGTRVIALGERGEFGCPLILMMKARKSLAKGCDSFLAYVIDAKKEKKMIADIPVVRDFPEVFLDELPGFPPVREVEYRIELMPGSTPVAKAPYRLASSEIRNMMTQIQDLLDHGFIRPSSSP